MRIIGISEAAVRGGKAPFIGLFLLLLAIPALSQVGLAVKGFGFGQTCAVRKGMNLSVARYFRNHDSVNYSLEGKLAGITDSSITLHETRLNRDTTVLFRDIAEVKIGQSGAGKAFSYSFLTAGVLMVIGSPAAGFTDSGSPVYDAGEFLAVLGVGLVMTTIGVLSVLPYEDTYRVTGACRNGNEKFLYNGNGTYYFSFATGMGASYGGLGFRLQARYGGIMGVGAHVGFGWMFPYLSGGDEIYVLENTVSVLAGAKFFPWRGFYLGMQFGNFGRIADVTWNGDQMILSNARSPWGTVFSAGWDCFLSRSFGLNLGAGMAVDLSSPGGSVTFPTFDAGFIFKL